MSAPEFVVFVKRDCATSRMVAPLLVELDRSASLTIWSQDDPGFPAGLSVSDDTDLEQSFRAGVETVPTLLRIEGGAETARTVGWNRDEWRRLTELDLGADLPAMRPGCGSRTTEPGAHEHLVARYG
ncbi:MAG: thioredoxin, partial [Acidimicrobiia bacterium]|nr:thioredoxin [Acidimicrobiia bacterium]